MQNEIAQYISELNRQFQTGSAREHTYRPALQRLLSEMLTHLIVSNEPARQVCGAPDLILLRKNDNIPIAYVETKDIGDSDLAGRKKNKEQFDRYKAALSELIFTDYLEFHLYEHGEHVDTVRLAQIKDDKIQPIKENIEKFESLIKRFGKAAPQTIVSATKLAEIMAKKARLMAEVIEKVLTNGHGNGDDDAKLVRLMNTFKDALIQDITPRKFADVYSQTIAYGMFATWQQHNTQSNQFNRKMVAELIPKTNPLLRKLFQDIAGYDLDKRISWIVDDLAEAFRVAKVQEVMKDFGKRTPQTDPMIHFYETFLTKYDPKERRNRGVWYTPQAVVQFIVRAVDEILQTEFGLPMGLANTSKIKIAPKANKRGRTVSENTDLEVHRVQILDPATGTGAFLVETVSQIREKIQRGMWHGYVQEHLIPRLNGFEVLMAPYTLAHLNLDLVLKQKDYAPVDSQRFQVYLTNSLEEQHPDTGNFFYELAHEADEANRIKRDTPVMVVMGNPPYNGKSQNKGKWIMGLMKDYKKEPASHSPINERNSKWINNDYCKFVRLGQFFVKNNTEGVLAYINSNSFIDSPTFRGMRWSLLTTFDKIYVLDLHGNSNKKETAPDGGKDENVFDIKEGVSINIFIKTGRKKADELAKVFHFDLYGEREEKYEFLSNHTLQKMKKIWRDVKLTAPQYFFTTKELSQAAKEEYEKGFSIKELFPVNSVGVVTARDSLTIHYSKKELIQTINEFIRLDTETARERLDLGNDTRDWSIAGAKKDLTTFPDFQKITKINYRPFDSRYTYYTGITKGFHCMPRDNVMRHFLMERPREKVMQHFLKGNNVGLTITRQTKMDFWGHVFITDVPTSALFVEIKDNSSVFPLYLYREEILKNGKETMLETKTPNLDVTIVNEIAQRLGLQFTDEKEESKKTFAPIDILDYIYAVLHSPSYRERYKEFLKIDFPRVPYPDDAKTFWKLVKLGEKLRLLHLMESVTPKKELANYDVNGNNVVEKFEYTNGKVKINDTQYFDNVPDLVWNFFIGGYQPAQKWLKDRKGRTLDFDEIQHYQKIVAVLNETEKLMNEADSLC